MLSESGNSTYTVAKKLVSGKTGFGMAAVLANQDTHQMQWDLINLSVLEFISLRLKKTYQEEYHQVPQQ